MTIKAILFDLDGTLLNTLDDLADSGNQALAAFGLPPRPNDDYRLMVGAGARNLVLRAAANASGLPQDRIPEQMVKEMLAVFVQEYARNWAVKTLPYPGVRELLDKLSAAGLKLAVLSNKPDDFTQAIMAHFFRPDEFVAVAGKLPDWPIKPDPALALELCRQMGVEPGEMALVGDSGSDMETAVRAGMLPVGVLWGFRDEAEMTGAGAVWLAETPAALGDFLLSQARPNHD